MTQEYDDILRPYRERIDRLDSEIIALLARRREVIAEVARVKAEHGIPAVLPGRVDAVRARAADIGREKGLDPGLIARIYTLLIDHACAYEESCIRKPEQGP